MARVKQIKLTKRKKKRTAEKKPAAKPKSKKKKAHEKRVREGKDPKSGHFLPGNKVGTGTAPARSTWQQHQAFRQAIREHVTIKDILDIYSALIKKAKKGDAKCAKLLLERMFGKIDLAQLPNHWEKEPAPKYHHKKKDEKKEAIKFWKTIADDHRNSLTDRIKARDKLDELLGFKKIKVDFNPEEVGQEIREFIAEAELQENNGEEVDTGIAE